MCKRICVVFALLFQLFFLGGCIGNEKTNLQPAVLEDNSKEQNTKESVVVHVCGAVKCPGVYELAYGSRIYEAIECAGGFRKKADVTGLNQAQLLVDEMQIYVPVKGEQSLEGKTSDKVNINTASKEELMTLTGVGEAKANAIILYREKNGRFEKIEDIMKISGIKEGMFAKIEDSITV